MLHLVNLYGSNFDVLLAVHLSIILAVNQLMHKIFFYNKFIIKEDFVH